MGIDKLDKDTDFQWHAGQADVPGLSASEMKAFMDAPVHTLVDKVNEVIGEVDAEALSTLKETLEQALEKKADDEDLKTLREDLDKKANADALNTEITALEKRDDTLSAEITALSNQSINITKVILEGLSDLGTQQKNHSTDINNLNTQQEEQNAALNELSTQQESHSTAINELSAQQASTAPVFIDHFDLTVEEITNIYSECILKGRALIIKEGSSKYACTQVYANGTGDQIAFIYTKCSSSGVVTFNRHGYVMKSGMHYPTVYTLQTM